MDDEHEVLGIERTRLRALVERDLAVADPLHADDYQLVTPLGFTYSKADYLGDIAAGRLAYAVFEPAGEVAVRASADLVVLRYVARIQVSFDGSGLALIDAWHTDHYERRDGRWVAVWSQATEVR